MLGPFEYFYQKHSNPKLNLRADEGDRRHTSLEAQPRYQHTAPEDRLILSKFIACADSDGGGGGRNTKQKHRQRRYRCGKFTLHRTRKELFQWVLNHPENQ